MANESSISPLNKSARYAIVTYLGISALVFVLMMLLGLLMRMGQAQWLAFLRISFTR